MFGINKNGTKHKIGIIMPAFFPSSRVTHESVSVTADGVKTYSQMLDAVYAAMDTSKLTYYSVLTFNKEVFNINFLDATTPIFGETLCISANRIEAKGCRVQASGSIYAVLQSSGVTNISSSVPSSGTVFTVVY